MSEFYNADAPRFNFINGEWVMASMSLDGYNPNPDYVTVEISEPVNRDLGYVMLYKRVSVNLPSRIGSLKWFHQDFCAEFSKTHIWGINHFISGNKEVTFLMRTNSGISPFHKVIVPLSQQNDS